MQRIAFIGAGGITFAHKKAFLQHPSQLSVAGIADPNLDAATKLAAELGKGIPVFADYKEMLASIKDRMDGVVITTPHFLHLPMASDVLNSGLPALVEKPVCCNTEELRLLHSLEKPGALCSSRTNATLRSRRELD